MRTQRQIDRIKRRIYGDMDPREAPVYSVGEASRYLHLSWSTLSSWVRGREYAVSDGKEWSEPLITRPKGSSLLSFNNLVEAHVLKSLRTRHGIPMRGIRTAVEYAREQHGIDRLFLRDDLLTVADDPSDRRGPGALFLERYVLEEISARGQLVIREALKRHLERVERDVKGAPVRLYPFLHSYVDPSDRSVLIDPAVSFGRPVLSSRGIRVITLVDRIEAGETVRCLAADYGIEEAEITAAVEFYEQAA